MTIPVKTQTGGYDITLERGALDRAGKLMSLSRRALIVTDDGVPEEYAKRVARQCESPHVITLPQGEATKSMDSFARLLREMTRLHFDRNDCVVAVGGGVMGDLAGFAAACYMRGIDFYNIPTTVLSQVDSSIGGKVAIDFEGYKNTVGAFYPPRAVVIDPDTLKTLPDRQISNGLAEAVKMALTCDRELFEMIESESADIDTVIYRSLLIKKQVVEKDERETGLRRVLNFGHTLAHAIESCGALYHGECVALGMLPMCENGVRARLLPVLERLRLPTRFEGDPKVLFEAMRHDKKLAGDTINVIYVPRVGEFEMKKLSVGELEGLAAKAVGK